MLRVNTIAITQFKNYTFSSFDFKERIVGICGLNGRGKTNLLDAIYYCCFTKSYFSKIDGFNVHFNKEGFRLESFFNKSDQVQKITCIYRGTGKKELWLNDVLYEKMSQHIGKFPAVMIAPDDIELIIGNSEERRRYMDTLLSQMDASYLYQLIQYNKILLQRNSLLKRFAEQGKTDWELLEVLDEQLTEHGKFIYNKRREVVEELIPLIQKLYHKIADNGECVALRYDSHLNGNSFEGIINQFRQKDFLLQRTHGGIHKDDLVMQLDGQPFKIVASQGQRKNLLFALKLAEFELLKRNKGFTPLLLLDDVFEKLDNNRMEQLLHWVCKENDGQVFITDTHKERLEEALIKSGTGFEIIEL